MSERCIFHSDINSFYASVEMMLDPSLKGKAVAVCGSTEERHGIVLAKSEKAKKAGIKTGMVNHQALNLCPELKIVHPHYDEYVKYSELVRQIYENYTDKIEPFGMDECWLDVTGSLSLFGGGMKIAEEIRERVREELGITVSIGVSFNKIFAKLGSDMKKPDAITAIGSENFREKVWKLPVSELLYIGRSTTYKLAQYGIFTIGQLANMKEEAVCTLLGKNGGEVWKYANGLDNSRVMHKDFEIPLKSVGHGITCNADLASNEEVWRVILELSQDIGHRLRVHKLRAGGVQLSIRDNKLFWQQHQAKLAYASISPEEIAELAFSMFCECYNWQRHIRSLTVTAIDLMPIDEPFQTDFFTNVEKHEKTERIDNAIEEIRGRFGNNAIFSASLMGNRKIPRDAVKDTVLPGLMYK